MASAVAQASNGGLGQSPQRGLGAELLVQGQGQSLFKLKDFLEFLPPPIRLCRNGDGICFANVAF